jgi:hypothetical protein
MTETGMKRKKDSGVKMIDGKCKERILGDHR